METTNPEIQEDLKTQSIRNMEKTATEMKIKLFKTCVNIKILKVVSEKRQMYSKDQTKTNKPKEAADFLKLNKKKEEEKEENSTGTTL